MRCSPCRFLSCVCPAQAAAAVGEKGEEGDLYECQEFPRRGTQQQDHINHFSGQWAYYKGTCGDMLFHMSVQSTYSHKSQTQASI